MTACQTSYLLALAAGGAFVGMKVGCTLHRCHGDLLILGLEKQFSAGFLQTHTNGRFSVNADEILVGSLALVFAVVTFSIGVGPWSAPYQLRTFQAVANRHGKPAARVVWVLISVAFLVVGVSVLLGLRPSYADLSEGSYAIPRDGRTPHRVWESSAFLCLS